MKGNIMKNTTNILLGLALALIGACASHNDSRAAGNGMSAVISASGKTYSELKYFIDKDKVGRLDKQADGSYTAAALALTEGTHTIKLVGDNRNVTDELTVKINDHLVCQPEKDSKTFAMPITADQACPDLLLESVRKGMHLASQETEIPPFSDQGSYDQLIRKKLPFVIVDVECLGITGCTDKLTEIKAGGARILIYVNPQECMLGSNLNDRPFQKALCGWAHANAQDWFLKDANGKPVILWHAPEMETLNLSTTAVQVGGLTWSQYFINYYLHILSQHAEVLDGILLDNAKAYISYEPSVILRDLPAGGPMDAFRTDESWRAGYRAMLEYMHDEVKKNYPQLTKGKEFLTAVVSKQFFFSDLADVVIFESPFNSSVGALTDDYHPFAVVDQYLRMAAKTRLMMVEHCVTDNGECQKLFYPTDHGRETGYALTLLADNSLYVFDQSGPLSHGGFSDDPIYKVSGKAKGDVQYPFAPVFTKTDKTVLTDGQSITLHVRTGDIVRFSYRMNGAYGRGKLNFPGASSITSFVDGTVNGFATFDGDYVINYAGQGSADVSDIMQLDPSQSNTDSMFCREYQFVKACYNPSASQSHTMNFGTASADVPPMQGRVLSK